MRAVARPGGQERGNVRGRWWSVPAVILGLLAGGCALIHPKSGDGCKEGEAICQGTAAAIVCRSGGYVPTSCGGPTGCTMQPSRKVRCDQSQGAKDGQPCLLEYEGRGQCLDDGAYAQCEGGSWRRHACPNSRCQETERGVDCVD